MKPKQASADEAAQKALEEFLQAQDDVSTVHSVEQKLELHIVETDAYINSYLRQTMDQNHRAPVTAVITRTNRQAKKVFFFAADDPEAANARKLRSTDELGPAYFAIGVPLRTLRIKLPEKYRLVLPVNTLPDPDGKTIYWISFSDYEKERRKLETNSGATTQGQKKGRTKKGEETAPTTA